MRVVDSSGWIEYLVDAELADEYDHHLRQLSDIATPTIVMYEVYKRITRDRGRQAGAMAVAQMMKTKVIPLNEGLALLAGTISLEHGLHMADAIIYATAQSVGAILVTSDEHFETLPGVEYIPRSR